MHSCRAGRHNEVCLRLGRVGSRGWWAMYHLRFVLDGILSICRLVVLKCVTFKSSSTVNPKDLKVFFWCRQDQKGTGIYIFQRFGEIRSRKCALTGAFLMS